MISKTFGLEKLPYHMRGGMERWISHGVMPGDFGTAVLENDLVKAFGYADDTNQACMKVWAQWLYNDAPAGCWGSKEKVEEWEAHHGLSGLQARLDTQASRQVHSEEPMASGKID
jgi:hypothetical protein